MGFRVLVFIVFSFLSFNNIWGQRNIYVSPNGNDNNPGTKEKPFKTIEAALDMIRATQQVEMSNIILRGGNYYVNKTLEFDERESGYKGAPFVLSSYPGERARLIGGVKLKSGVINRTVDNAILDRIISPEARKHIFEIDLKEAGLEDYGHLISRGMHRAILPNVMEITINGERLRMAQWPNIGSVDKELRELDSNSEVQCYIKMPEPIYKGSVPRKGDFSNKGGIIEYSSTRPNSYQSKDVFIAGFLGNGYSFDMIPIKTIDKEKKQIELSEAHMYGLASHSKWGNRGSTEYFFLNVLEEIDEPGESYLDRQSGIIYFLLPEGINLDDSLEIFASIIEDPIIAIEEASYFQLRNVNIECGRGMGIYMEGGEYNLIEGCSINNLGTAGIMLGKGVDADSVKYRHEYTGKPKSRTIGSWQSHTYQNSTFNRNAGRNHQIKNCDIFDIGVVGIIIGGGDRRTLEPGNNIISNCRIKRTENVAPQFMGAINIGGVGNRIEHCEISDLYDIAILSWGNDIEIKYNEFHHCLRNCSEKGLIYTGRNPSAFNLQVENNFIHHNGNPFGYTAIVHMDDFACGLVFRNNICYHNDRKFFINSGYLHTIENNVFIDNFTWDSRPVKNEQGIRCGKTPDEWRNLLENKEVIKDRLFGVLDVRKPPYSIRYPELTEIVINPEKSKGTVQVRNNVCINSGILVSHRPNENPGGDNLFDNWVVENAVLEQLNLGFVDVGKLDFTMNPNSEAMLKIPNFSIIDFEKIGCLGDNKNKEAKDN